MSQLTSDFVIELFKLCLRNRNVLHTSAPHVKYTFLPDEYHKEVWKAILTYDNVVGQPPTIGVLTQQFVDNPKVLEVLSNIKKANMPNKDSIFNQIEEYVKKSLFIEAYDKIGDLYNEDKKEDAFNQMQLFADLINEFSIKQSYYDKVFEDHQRRHIDRRVSMESGLKETKKAPFGIHELDDISHGGNNIGDIALILAQSGVGKTKLLRHIGVTNARLGHKVLHIQLEGSRAECLDGYDATWSGSKISDIEYATLDQTRVEKMKKAAQNINGMGGEIYVEAFEQFDSATLQDVRQMIIDIEKVHGKLDVVVIDYLELLDPGNKKHYKVSEERQRREALANGLKNIALEFKIAIFTATQASTVAPSMLNDPDFIQTRYDISEFKGVIKPFSIFITLNQTSDEYNNRFMRIYVDKLRKYRGGQIIKIYQRYDVERFYDAKKTLNELYVTNAA